MLPSGLRLLVLALLFGAAGCNFRQAGDGVPRGDTAATAGGAAEAELFAEVTEASGIHFTYRNGEDSDPPQLAILESLGGGVALLDFDGDGLLDVYIPGGGGYGGPDRTTICGRPGRLYRNQGNWKFQDITKEAGLETLANGQPWFYSHAVSVGDYNRDGWPDLLITGWGRIALFRNDARGQGGRGFTDVSTEAGLDRGITWAVSAAWSDLDGDQWPDLYVCQYVDWSFANHPRCDYDGKTLDVCPPKKFQGLPDKLYRNNADGTFTDVSAAAGLVKGGSGSKSLGVLSVDVNLDGKPEVYVANDTVANFLYVNESTPGQIRLREQGLAAGVALDGHGGANGSMGVDAGDADGSGWPWLWTTNYENELHALYRNLCRKDRVCFFYQTQAAGIAAIGQKYVGWGTGFVDLDHHGWEDLFIVNGHAIRYPTGAARRQKPVLLRNQKGKFKDITPRGGPYFREAHLARGAALGDLDNDGKVDLIICHINEPVAVLRNVAQNDYHWLGIQLKDARHADLVGSRLILEAAGRRQTRFAKGGGSYASSPDPRFVFGLGSVHRLDRLTVIWPNGQRQEWTDLALDRYHTLERSAAMSP